MLMRRFASLITWITVEPIQFIYCLMFSVSSVVRDNLFIDKACLLDLNYTSEICYNMTHKRFVPKEMKDAIQTRTAELTVYDGILVALPSVLFCLFVGTWSDRHGRKLLLVIPFVGNLLSFVAYMINYHFFYELGTLHLLWGSVVGISGSYICLNMGLYGYISDVTSPEDRTTRLSILNGVFSAGYVAGTSLGGFLYKKYENYYLNFGISVALSIVGMVAGALVRESVTPERRADFKSDGTRNGLAEFFSLDNLKQSLLTTFRWRPRSGRIHVILLVINFAIFMFCLNTNHFDYLLVINKYNWDAADFSYYLSIQRICRFVGLFLLLPLMSKVFKFNDALVASICTVSSVLAYVLMAFGQKDWTGPNGDWAAGWIMYLSAVLQLNSIITVAIRSQCTKEVDRTEIGRIFAVVGLGQAIVPLISNPLFGGIYTATLSTFPGAYLLVISGMFVFVIGSSVFMFVNQRRNAERPEEELLQQPQQI